MENKLVVVACPKELEAEVDKPLHKIYDQQQRKKYDNKTFDVLLNAISKEYLSSSSDIPGLEEKVKQARMIKNFLEQYRSGSGFIYLELYSQDDQKMTNLRGGTHIGINEPIKPYIRSRKVGNINYDYLDIMVDIVSSIGCDYQDPKKLK